jgi:hypothetical protein
MAEEVLKGPAAHAEPLGDFFKGTEAQRLRHAKVPGVGFTDEEPVASFANLALGKVDQKIIVRHMGQLHLTILLRMILFLTV